MNVLEKIDNYIEESSFSGSNRDEFDKIKTTKFKGQAAAAMFQFFLTDVKRITGNKLDWSYKIKGDTIIISYEDDSQQQEEFYKLELKAIKATVNGG